jgi:hypothetical protein
MNWSFIPILLKKKVKLKEQNLLFWASRFSLKAVSWAALAEALAYIVCFASFVIQSP